MDLPDGSTPKPQLYDDQVARFLLADLTRDWDHNTHAKKKAAQALIAQLVELAKDYGIAAREWGDRAEKSFIFYPRPTGTGVIVSPDHVYIRVRRDTPDDAGQRVPLRFNPTAKRFESVDNEDLITPISGELPQRRSALAVVTAAMIAAAGPA